MKAFLVLVLFYSSSAFAQLQIDLSKTGSYIKNAISDLHSVNCSFEATTEVLPLSGKSVTSFSIWFKNITEAGQKLSYSGSLLHLDPVSLEKVMTAPESTSFTTFDSKKVFLEVLGATRVITVQPEFEGEWLQKRGVTFRANLVFIDGNIQEVTFKYWKNRGIIKGKELVFEDECVF